MATRSFHEMMVIDTDEKLQNLILAFEDRKKRGPYVPTTNVFKELEESEKKIKDIRF
ncbi:MAG: hypothetical protein LBG62_07365 [Candidatus Methanoplasma sp.]|jgi:hypothetical protein|nr:hypothetical protein [Candidatus Methanoplasma sp.]